MQLTFKQTCNLGIYLKYKVKSSYEGKLLHFHLPNFGG